jgi:hypothetical protein
MTDSRADPSSGDPPPPVCPRCARRVDMAAIGPQVGLCHCLSCQRFACRWCWLKARGRCPTCAAPYEVWAAASATAARPLPTRRRRKLDRRAVTAIGALVVVMAWLTLSAIQWFGSAGGTESRSSPPGIAAGGGPSASGATASNGVSAPPTGPTASQPAVTVRPGATPPAAAETAVPTPTPAATPRRTAPPPPPTPRPTPRPTPIPTPSCEVVPNLRTLTVGDARAAWTAAGFTGPLLPKGHDAWIVAGQDRKAGTCLALSTAITVTAVKP